MNDLNYHHSQYFQSVVYLPCLLYYLYFNHSSCWGCMHLRGMPHEAIYGQPVPGNLQEETNLSHFKLNQCVKSTHVPPSVKSTHVPPSGPTPVACPAVGCLQRLHRVTIIIRAFVIRGTVLPYRMWSTCSMVLSRPTCIYDLSLQIQQELTLKLKVQ